MAGQLTWGLKESFRRYVEGAGGAIEAGEGAGRDAEGVFVFPGVEAPAEPALRVANDGRLQGVARYRGEVRCQAHGGMLDVFLADPVLDFGPDGATLSVADTPERDSRTHLANLDLAAARLEAGEWLIPARLSREGWRVIGDHYLPATPLDPVRLRL